MGLKEIIKTMNSMIDKLMEDLKKSERGIKAASQRVRTGTIKLAKIAKIYRKESVVEEKKMKKKSVTKNPPKTIKAKAAKKKKR